MKTLRAALMVFMVALAVVLGAKMSPESISRLSNSLVIWVSVILGLIAGLPTMILLFILIKKQNAEIIAASKKQPAAPAPQQPPVIVVGAPQPQMPAPAPPPMIPDWQQTEESATPGKFRVVGFDDEDEDW